MLLGLAPVFSLSDLRPIFAEAGIEPEGLLIFEPDNENEPPVAFGIPLDSSPFDEMGFFDQPRYLGVLINSRRHDEVISAIRFLFGSP